MPNGSECACDPAYFLYDGRCLAIAECEKNSGEVVGGVCQCKHGAVSVDGICKCDVANNFMEDGNKCKCKDGHYDTQQGACAFCDPAKHLRVRADGSGCECAESYYADGDRCALCDAGANVTVSARGDGCECKQGHVTMQGADACILEADCSPAAGYQLADGVCAKLEAQDTNRAASSNTGMIVGIVVGVLVLIIIAAVVAAVLVRKKKLSLKADKLSNHVRRVVE